MLLGPDKKSLNEKIALGWQKSTDENKIHVFTHDGSVNLMFHALQQADGSWIKPKQDAALFTLQIQKHFGQHECFLFPIQVQQKPIGLIYCDRSRRSETLTLEDFSVAKHFAKQAQIGLTLFRMQKA